MQVTTVSEPAVATKGCGNNAEGQAGSGEFDLVMAALCAMISPAPVNAAQGQGNSGGEKVADADTNGLFPAGPAVSAKGTVTGLPEKDQAGALPGQQPESNGAAGNGVDNVLQALAELSPVPADKSGSPGVPQAVPAIIPAPGNPGAAMTTAQKPQLPGQSATSAGEPVQQAVPTGGQTVLTQLPAGAEPAAVQGQQQSISPPQETAGMSQVQLIMTKQEPAAAQEEKTAASVAGQNIPAAAGEQTAASKNGMNANSVSVEKAENSLAGPKLETAVAKDQKEVIAAAVARQSIPAAVGEKTAELKNGMNAGSPPAEKTENGAGGQKIKQDIAVLSNEAGQAEGKEDKPGAAKTEAVKINSNVAQPTPVTVEQSVSARSTGDVARGVALPDLKERLVQEIKNIFTTNRGEPQTQVQLKLEPENLGQLTIKLYIHKGELNAHFYTGNSYVKDILEGSVQQLREALGQQDLRLNEALVFTNNSGGSGMDRYYDGRDGRPAPAYGGYNHRTYGEPQTETAGLVASETNLSRVNYLI